MARRPTGQHLSALVQAGHARAATLEPRLAGLLVPILEDAGRKAAARFRSMVTDHLTAAAGVSAFRAADDEALRRVTVGHGLTAARGLARPFLSGWPTHDPDRFARLTERHLSGVRPITAAVDVQSTSTMVAVMPRPDEAAALADPDGYEPSRLHCTLVYIGELDGPLDAVRTALATVAGSHAPLEGIVGGYGQFGTPDGGAVGILLPDVPGLVELRVAVTEALAGDGVGYARDHGFEAHITVDPDPEPGEWEAYGSYGQPLHFDRIYLVRGDVVEADFPLTGRPPLTAAGQGQGQQPGWTPPAADEVVDVAAIVGAIKARTVPVRTRFLKATMSPILEAAGLSFDVTNPLTAKVLAQSGSQIQEIADTTRLNVMRIIRDSYEAGLSIPHTAEAIREGMTGAALARATLIARTELVGAVNGGSLAAVQIVSSETGASYMKRWLTAPGAANPRHETYEGLDGQTVALDDYFDLGDAQLMFPGDPDGPPDEVCNCRCAVAYDDGSIEESEA